jgi:DNA-binding transcriptional MocR family regulator
MNLADLFTPQARTFVQTGWGAPPESPIPLISVAFGLADPALFPREELVEAAAEVLSRDINAALNYGPSDPALRELIAERLRRENVAADPANVLVGYGSGQILGLLPRVLVEPGDTVIIEAPTFLGAVGQFQRAGASLVGVPVDAEGLDVDALEATLRDLQRRGVRPKFIYTIPTYQNPTGTTLPAARRERLVSLAATYGVLVVEDDAYRDLSFHGPPPPSLAAIDTEGWVLRVGTFSKILAPGLRMGWAHGPRDLIDRLTMFKVEGGSGPFLTRLVTQFSSNGRLDAHIAALRSHYAAKCDLMLEALATHVPDAHAVRPDGGFFIWLRLPEGVRTGDLVPAAINRGVEVLPGPRCYADGQGDNYIRLAFSEEPAANIQEAIRRLGQAVADVRG